jgi:hypothetical protein
MDEIPTERSLTMRPKAWTSVAAGLAALAVAAAPAGAEPLKDYSLNGATGAYAPQVHLVKNYGLNGATGDYAPQRPSAAPVVAAPSPQEPAVTGNDFAWGSAFAGAGATLLLVLAFGGTLRIRRRTSSTPRVA